MVERDGETTGYPGVLGKGRGDATKGEREGESGNAVSPFFVLNFFFPLSKAL